MLLIVFWIVVASWQTKLSSRNYYYCYYLCFSSLPSLNRTRIIPKFPGAFLSYILFDLIPRRANSEDPYHSSIFQAVLRIPRAINPASYVSTTLWYRIMSSLHHSITAFGSPGHCWTIMLSVKSVLELLLIYRLCTKETVFQEFIWQKIDLRLSVRSSLATSKMLPVGLIYK